MRRRTRCTSLGFVVVLLIAAVMAQPAAGVPTPPQPIPEGPESSEPPVFKGAPAQPLPITATLPPEHPFMAPNGRSNIHNDAYMSGAYEFPGPLGRNMERLSTFQVAECASVTFDREGRIVSICVGLERPRVVMFDPHTLDKLAEFPLPPRTPGTGNPFNDFSGGGYFYLDHLDRAVIPTSHRHIWVVGETSGPLGPEFALERDYDLSGATAVDDRLMSVLPDWSGRLWWVSQKGVVGTIDPDSGAVRTLALGEQITNSFSVDESGGVYIVSDAALYRFDAGATGEPVVTWREVYPNSGIHKPGQSGPGSGTTPDVMGSNYVAIADNADPMQVVVYKRAKTVSGPRMVCAQPVFAPGAGATDNSLITVGRSIIVENNYGYSGLTATMDGKTTAPGIERVAVNPDGSGCRTVWRNAARAPSVVPKLSLATGLIYAYTKPPLATGTDAWYFTALDFRSGRFVYKRLAGTGLGFNNNWAPVTLGPDGTAYVGALGGLVLLRDRP
jgi:hypothetical protein